jgi:hypothetical protein
VQVVLVSTVLAPLGVPLIAPVLPVVGDAFTIGEARASLLVDTYFVGDRPVAARPAARRPSPRPTVFRGL